MAWTFLKRNTHCLRSWVGSLLSVILYKKESIIIKHKVNFHSCCLLLKINRKFWCRLKFFKNIFLPSNEFFYRCSSQETKKKLFQKMYTLLTLLWHYHTYFQICDISNFVTHLFFISKSKYFKYMRPHCL